MVLSPGSTLFIQRGINEELADVERAVKVAIPKPSL